MVEGNKQSKNMGQLISKALSDQAFKKRLLTDTMAVMKEHGIAVPDGVTVKAVENTDKVFHLIIPQKLELSDEQLEAMSGGFGPCGQADSGLCARCGGHADADD